MLSWRSSVALMLIMATGPANFVSYRVLYAVYGESSAFFVSQGVNIIYIIYGGGMLYPKMIFTDEITPEMRALPHNRFIVMALLDFMGQFLAATGAMYTPGTYQTLFNQCLIPWTIFSSWFFLGTSFTRKQLIGAAVILFGASFSVIAPALQVEAEDSEVQWRWYSVTLYFLSNVPMALSAVYKESRFAGDDIHVLYLTQWVSIYQFLIGFPFAFLLVIPGIGSRDGQSLTQIFSGFMDGWNCFLQASPNCPPRYHSFLLLTGYCLINFVFNTLGVFLTKHGGAALNSISYSLLLPLTTISYSLPFLGKYRESLAPCTLEALTIVLLGFFIYQFDDVASSSTQRRPSPLFSESTPCSVGIQDSSTVNATQYCVSSYQERVVLIEIPISQHPHNHTRAGTYGDEPDMFLVHMKGRQVRAGSF